MSRSLLHPRQRPRCKSAMELKKGFRFISKSPTSPRTTGCCAEVAWSGGRHQVSTSTWRRATRKGVEGDAAPWLLPKRNLLLPQKASNDMKASTDDCLIMLSLMLRGTSRNCSPGDIMAASVGISSSLTRSQPRLVLELCALC